MTLEKRVHGESGETQRIREGPLDIILIVRCREAPPTFQHFLNVFILSFSKAPPTYEHNSENERGLKEKVLSLSRDYLEARSSLPNQVEEIIVHQNCKKWAELTDQLSSDTKFLCEGS